MYQNLNGQKNVVEPEALHTLLVGVFLKTGDPLSYLGAAAPYNEGRTSKLAPSPQGLNSAFRGEI